MLPNQFAPLNAFGIPGDIFISYFNPPDGNLYKMSFYNTNPNKTYEYINFPFNFGASISSGLKRPDIWKNSFTSNNITFNPIRDITFYNFNQSKLSLLISNPVGFFANTYNFRGFYTSTIQENTSNIDVELGFNTASYNFDYMFCYDIGRPLNFTNYVNGFSNIIINFGSNHKKLYKQGDGSEYTGKYMFYNYDFFNNEKNFKEIYMPFLYFDDLNHCFALEESGSTLNLVKKVNLTLAELLNSDQYVSETDKIPVLRNIDNLLEYRSLEDDYYAKHPEGFITTSFSLPALDTATRAFSTLNFNAIDIENLLNLLPTKTDGKVHNIGIGKDSTITTDQVNDYINRYNQKGWTLTIS